MRKKERIRVHYDAQCGLCRNSRLWVEARDADGVIEFVPLDAAETGTGTSQRPTAADLLVEAAGTPPQVGFAGWLTVLRRLPGWRRLAFALTLPPLHWIGAAVYRLVSRYRHGLLRRGNS